MRSKMEPLFGYRKTILLFFLSSLLLQLALSNYTKEPIQNICYLNDNSTNNSLFQNKVDILLTSVPPQASVSKFYNTTIGENKDKVYTVFQCWGDVSNQVCHDCVTSAAKLLAIKCPNTKEAIVWYEDCMLRYSNYSRFSYEYSTSNGWICSDVNVTSNMEYFDHKLSTMVNGLVDKAAYSSSNPNLATGEVNITEFKNLYGLVQCTPDMSRFECNRCIEAAANSYELNCEGAEWATIFQPSCVLRYTTSVPFYEISPKSSSGITNYSKAFGRVGAFYLMILGFIISLL